MARKSRRAEERALRYLLLRTCAVRDRKVKGQSFRRSARPALRPCGSSPAAGEGILLCTCTVRDRKVKGKSFRRSARPVLRPCGSPSAAGEGIQPPRCYPFIPLSGIIVLSMRQDGPAVSLAANAVLTPRLFPGWRLPLCDLFDFRRRF